LYFKKNLIVAKKTFGYLVPLVASEEMQEYCSMKSINYAASIKRTVEIKVYPIQGQS
jgi:hypothetical protein